MNETKAVHRSFEAMRKAWEREVMFILAARLMWVQARLALKQGHTRVSIGKAYAFPRPTTAPTSDEPSIGRT